MKQFENCIVAFISCVPVSVAVTFMAHSFWEWVETTTGVESIGHFGPSAWCFVVVYFVVLTIFMVCQKLLKKNNIHLA